MTRTSFALTTVLFASAFIAPTLYATNSADGASAVAPVEPADAGASFDPAVPYVSMAPVAYMIDLQSGQELFVKDADRPIPPASMAKMMTTHLAFRLIREGKLRLDQSFVVRPETWKKWHGPSAGSTMFLSPNEKVSVENLLHGIVTLSGNDACMVLAEGIAGTEAAFVAMMNEEAQRLGLKNSRFGTSNGWPDEGRTMVSARDLARIAVATIEETPDLYRRFYGTRSFTWGRTMGGGDITQANRNPILGRIDGADGLKTGHTAEAGYGFTGSAEQDGRRIVMVVAGIGSFNDRVTESVRFMDWGFNAWANKSLFKQGAKVATARVQMGDARSIDLVAGRTLAVTLPKGRDEVQSIAVRYNGPLRAPIAKGATVAELVITPKTGKPVLLPLIAGSDVAEAGVVRRIWNGLMSLFG